MDPVPFAGVPQLLRELHERGVPLATATSKQAPMALAQMKSLGLTDVFDVIAGATPDPSSTKATVIREALAQLERRGVDVGAPLLVGDSLWDVIGGHEAGVPVLGVGWGYATAGGLDNAEEVCENVEELRSFLLSHTRREG